MGAWWHWVGLFAAGGCGVCLRFALSLRVDRWAEASLPHVGTLAVNLLGCLLIGLLSPVVPSNPARAIVITGMLGGFTTYSTFALLGTELAEAHRWGPLAWQLGLHLGGGALLVVIGARLGTRLGVLLGG